MHIQWRLVQRIYVVGEQATSRSIALFYVPSTRVGILLGHSIRQCDVDIPGSFTIHQECSRSPGNQESSPREQQYEDGQASDLMEAQGSIPRTSTPPKGSAPGSPAFSMMGMPEIAMGSSSEAQNVTVRRHSSGRGGKGFAMGASRPLPSAPLRPVEESPRGSQASSNGSSTPRRSPLRNPRLEELVAVCDAFEVLTSYRGRKHSVALGQLMEVFKYTLEAAPMITKKMASGISSKQMGLHMLEAWDKAGLDSPVRGMLDKVKRLSDEPKPPMFGDVLESDRDNKYEVEEVITGVRVGPHVEDYELDASSQEADSNEENEADDESDHHPLGWKEFLRNLEAKLAQGRQHRAQPPSRVEGTRGFRDRQATLRERSNSGVRFATEPDQQGVANATGILPGFELLKPPLAMNTRRNSRGYNMQFAQPSSSSNGPPQGLSPVVNATTSGAQGFSMGTQRTSMRPPRPGIGYQPYSQHTSPRSASGQGTWHNNPSGCGSSSQGTGQNGTNRFAVPGVDQVNLCDSVGIGAIIKEFRVSLGEDPTEPAPAWLKSVKSFQPINYDGKDDNEGSMMWLHCQLTWSNYHL
ncbi:hypothetical protein C8Q80DRAFT_1122129 [Daedaleopsis nitida]|nr:hypothetical protein C8Q80DRAFT_1122129 [Daedaleopsis nitida]